MLIPSWLPAKHLLAVAAMAAAGYGGFWLRDLQAQAADGARAKAELASAQKLADLADQVSKRTEDAIAGIRIENRTIHQKAVHEVQTNTIYRDCVLPDSGRLRANEARAAANASIGAVPAPASAP